MVELLAVVAAELAVEVFGVFEDGIEHAGAQLVAGEGFGIVGLVGEEAVEDLLGVHFGGQRGGGVFPGERVLVDAGVAAVAVAGAAIAFDGHFKRREAGLVAEPAGGDLVGGDAGVEVGAGGFLGLQRR